MTKKQIEKSDFKYMSDFLNQVEVFVSSLILNIYHGFTNGIGIPKKTDPFRQNFTERMSKVYKELQPLIFGRDLPDPRHHPFQMKQNILYNPKGKPISLEKWESFNHEVIKYLKPYIHGVAEEMAVKGMMLALATAEMEKQKKRIEKYGKYSYEQIEDEHYRGYIPESMKTMKERVKVGKTVERSMLQSYDRAAMYVQGVSDNVREAIRQQVVSAYQEGKSVQQLASDLYWLKKSDDEELKKHSADELIRDWQRVASTELAFIHSDGKLSAYEDQAYDSLEDNKKAVYFVFTGGTCKWCTLRHGTIVRFVPVSIVSDFANDSLSAMGIDDPYTDIAIWIGKTNVGYKMPEWRICCPPHPWGTAHFARIYPDSEYYDKESGRIRSRAARDYEKYLPENLQKEFKENDKARADKKSEVEADREKGIHKKPKEYIEKPTGGQVGTDSTGGKIVSWNDNLYVEVPKGEINSRMDEWRKNQHLPIPVEIGGKFHSQIFGKNQ